MSSTQALSTAEECLNKCKHCKGFSMVLLPLSAKFPAVWFCNEHCSFWLPFDPDAAGTYRPVVQQGEVDPYDPSFWGNMFIAYTPDPKGGKTWIPLSTGGKN
jgi:hypothetical protein